MIPQLVERLIDPRKFGLTQLQIPPRSAALRVLGADPIDLLLHVEEVWAKFSPPGPDPLNPQNPPPTARQQLAKAGAFSRYAPLKTEPAWDHLGYSYVLENTRAVQIFRRVVREYRSGEGLGIPSPATQRWLDATEALLFGAQNPVSLWLSTSVVRSDPEAVRRNAYWRLFGLDLAFGGDDNRAPVYDKAKAANASFVRIFEELLFELWQAISNLMNRIGPNQSDDDRIYRLAEELNFELLSRRQQSTLSREELAAATALGWIDLTLSFDSPVVEDLKATASSPADRLRLIGERVGLPPHSKSAEFLSMGAELSRFLRMIESREVSGPNSAWLLYKFPTTAETRPIGDKSRRVITEWASATGKDLKTRAKPVDTRQLRLVSAR